MNLYKQSYLPNPFPSGLPWLGLGATGDQEQSVTGGAAPNRIHPVVEAVQKFISDLEKSCPGKIKGGRKFKAGCSMEFACMLHFLGPSSPLRCSSDSGDVLAPFDCLLLTHQFGRSVDFAWGAALLRHCCNSVGDIWFRVIALQTYLPPKPAFLLLPELLNHFQKITFLPLLEESWREETDPNLLQRNIHSSMQK